MKKLYVGNLPYEMTEDDLLRIFSEHGEVASATIIRDKWENTSKGFGFVEMKEDGDAENAISSLDGTEHHGRRLKVNEARERQEGGGGRGGGRGGFGGGGRGGHGGGGHRGGRGGGGGRGGHGGGGGRW